jgi:peptidyl-prolyl cis-trans isomerase C
MKHFIIAAVLLAATAAQAQQAQTAVAVVNGEVISQEKLDTLYAAMSPQMRTQYKANGGKGAFLDNYIRKRLLIQEAMKSGFDKRPDVEIITTAARDSALFDRYVRDVIGSQFVTGADIQKYYESHKGDFATPEQMKLYHIIIVTAGANATPKADAAMRIQQIAVKLRDDVAAAQAKDPAAASLILFSFFKNAAQQYSQDASASKGGDLGWVGKGALDTRFEAAAAATPAGSVSPVVESAYGYHLIYVEATKPAGTAPLELVKPEIKEKLLVDHTPEIMQVVSKLSTELKAAGKVSVLPENIK